MAVPISVTPSSPSSIPATRRTSGPVKAALAVAVCALGATVAPVMSSPAATARSVPRADIRVSSFNIQSVALDKTRGEQRPWRQRRGTVINQILGERIDVIGVQEANPGTSFAPRLVDGANQYRDLRNGLNKAGGHYGLTNYRGYNCVNPVTAYKCRPRDRDASASERILYNTRKLTVVSRDSMRYRARGARYEELYLTWAVFRIRSTGHTFLFASTHLDPVHRAIRVAQWKQLITKINQIKGRRPVVVVGDFNAQKFDVQTKTMLPAMKRAGYGDVLNQQYQVNPSRGVRARTRINGWMNTYNHLSRNVAVFGYEDRHDKTGNGIDWIFASNWLPVKDYKVVLHWNRATGRVVGTLPSDHNMIRATLSMP
jgi:endonuclease/exonuclease/phosphatase family metal-dependent hydrolase